MKLLFWIVGALFVCTWQIEIHILSCSLYKDMNHSQSRCMFYSNTQATHWNSRVTTPNSELGHIPRGSWEDSSPLAVLLCCPFCPAAPHQLFFILCHTVVSYFHLSIRNSSAGQQPHNLHMLHLFIFKQKLVSEDEPTTLHLMKK